MSSIRANISSFEAGSRFTSRTSLIEPVGPPSELAPLSDTTTTIVLSKSPTSERKPSTRPICSSACERKPAKHSMNRAATKRSR